MESKLKAAKSYVQEHLDELAPEMRAAVEDLLTFLAEPKIEYVDERHLKFNNLTFCKTVAGYYKTAICPKVAGFITANSEHATWHNTHDFITVKCTNCGKEFQTRKANRGIHRFCSEECKNKFEKKPVIDAAHEKICAICGKKFYPRNKTSKTYSRPCRHTLVGRTRREHEAARKHNPDS